jgi:hypothetical protein
MQREPFCSGGCSFVGKLLIIIQFSFFGTDEKSTLIAGPYFSSSF